MATVRIEECDDKFVLIDFPDGGRTKLQSGSDVPEFASYTDAEEWACDNDFEVTDSVVPKDGETGHDDSFDLAAVKQAEQNKDAKALADCHFSTLERYHRARQDMRIDRAINRLTDEELDAEIARRRK